MSNAAEGIAKIDAALAKIIQTANEAGLEIEFTDEGEMVIWHGFIELCLEGAAYNPDKVH